MKTAVQGRWGILFAITATQFAIPFMLSAVGLALPVIGREFQADVVSLSLVESVFSGVTAMCLLVFGRASDLVGRRALFIVGLSIFTLVTVALGFAPNIAVLIGGRALQAVGGSMQLATGLAILFEAFPFEERGRVLGVTLAGVYLGVSAGPFLGGLITSWLGWRWLFFICVLPCLAALGLAVRYLGWQLYRPKESFDYLGGLLSMACIGLFIFGGAESGNLLGRVALCAAPAVLAAFVLWERRCEHPLLDVGIFRSNLSFSLGNGLQLFNYAATFGVTFLMSLYLQFGHGMSPAEAGTILVVQPLVQTLLTPICGRLADRMSPKPLVTVGMVLGVAAVGWASFFTPATGQASIVTVLALLGVGIAMFASPNMAMIMRRVRPHQYGMASAVTGQMRIVGMTASMVVISIVVSAIIGDQVVDAASFPGFNQGMRLVLRGFCLVGLAGAAMSLFDPGMKQEALAGEEAEAVGVAAGDGCDQESGG